ncbi:MarR family transcriptional regulator [Neobacillus sp. PS3-40]|uniref:MarR family winged helix-turn-helix transcriptional regulator n=1 Tax=Neobacillus sp. PS3-40 TaxID=3070679 RepID=UPI0027E17071|nr:MarR family transcriptional regulator [Neobacillus sp. PS3-40]WML42651.1 MarR family transcriptional regulator [Neobacillus sp. PS3-40]
MAEHNENFVDRKREILQEVQGLFEAVARKLKHKIQHSQSAFQLAGGQVFVMMMLHRQEICKASDIAAHLGITSGAVTGLTDKMVKMGILNRIRSEEDRRVVQFSLTAKGIEVLEHIRQERLQMLLGTFENLGTEDLEKMLEVFTKLNAVL